MSAAGQVPAEAVGLQLCKAFLNELKVCEPVKFAEGCNGVELVLRRAAISGLVEVGGDIAKAEHWADLLNADGDIIGHVRLDCFSFAALKGHWMRCRYVRRAA